MREASLDLILGRSDNIVKVGDLVEMLLGISFSVKDAMLDWEWLEIDSVEWPPQRLDWEMYYLSICRSLSLSLSLSLSFSLSLSLSLSLALSLSLSLSLYLALSFLSLSLSGSLSLSLSLSSSLSLSLSLSSLSLLRFLSLSVGDLGFTCGTCATAEASALIETGS